MATDANPGVAFVLSGGASLGAIQVGMLQALYERGISPGMIVGTSAGALNGAFIASRAQTVATAEALGEVWRHLHRGQAFPMNPVTGLLGFLGAREPADSSTAAARSGRRSACACTGMGRALRAMPPGSPMAERLLPSTGGAAGQHVEQVGRAVEVDEDAQFGRRAGLDGRVQSALGAAHDGAREVDGG